MRFGLLIAGGAVFTGVTGCSIHPLPEDFARDDTYRIIEKVWCEARGVLIEEFYTILLESDDPTVRLLVPAIKTGRRKLSGLRNSEFDDPTFNKLAKFRYDGIAMKFIFKITENNNNTGNASFKMPFVNGTFSLALKAGKEKGRVNERTVETKDSLEDLVVNEDRAARCADIQDPGKNFAYPITGNIGMSEFFVTYKNLVLANVNAITFSDKLTFTTKLVGEVKPSVELTNFVPKVLRLASADLTSGVDRTDSHEVSITVTDLRSEPGQAPVERIALGGSSGVILEIPKIKTVTRTDPKISRYAPKDM